MEKSVGRRHFLGVAGAGVAVGVTAGLFGGVERGDAAESPLADWTYVPIDPAEAAEAAYRCYPDGSCMYASFRGIIETFGQTVAQTNPQRGGAILQFPFYMMKYGRGGGFDYGSLCGVLNGSAAAIGLLCPDTKIAEKILHELFSYYENEPLPQYQPAESAISDLPPLIVESVLCHISSTRWALEADTPIASPRRKERCRRLTADGTAKTVELLNRWHKQGADCQFAVPPPEPAACIECHSPTGSRPDASTRMACGTCHAELSGTHTSE